MKPFCEVVVATVLPAVRSMVTRQLINDYRFTQQEAAELLGITQPAVCQYLQQARGTKVKILEKQPEVMKMIEEFVKDMAAEKMRPRELQSKFCKICKDIRKKGIICHLHEEIYPCIAPCSDCKGEC